MCECFSVVPVNQEERQGNNALITKVKISEHIMTAEDPTASDYPGGFTHHGPLCLQGVPGKERPELRGGHGQGVAPLLPWQGSGTGRG